MWQNKITKKYEHSGSPFLHLFFAIIVLCLSTSNTWGELPNYRMDYQDNDETIAELKKLRTNHPDIVTLKSIGVSYDIPEDGDPNVPIAYDIYAIRVGPVGKQDFDDAGDVIPSILFVGGIHGREWLTSESLLEFAKHLVERLQNQGTPEYAMLRRVAVWIIPIANPSGREIDDENAGDPLDFYSEAGNTIYGWRHSGDRRGCMSASDIARNFPPGWGDPENSDCDPDWNSHFKGVAPFSNFEATALSEFVQNHWICMAVDVHSSSQVIWNMWGGNDNAQVDKAGKKMKERSIEFWNTGLRKLAGKIYDIDPDSTSRIIENFVDRFTLHDKPLGEGNGQFTAWLQEEQHIPTFMVELPPNEDEYKNYYDGEFQYYKGDTSNSFHPSSSRVRHLIKDSFFLMAEYLTGQADAPGSATSIGFVQDGYSAHIFETTEPNGSHLRDFGILAAKIGRDGPGAPGKIISAPPLLSHDPNGNWVEEVPACSWLDYSYSQELYYWVQNYGYSTGSSSCTITIELKSRLYGSDDSVPWTVDLFEDRAYRLREREKTFDRFPFELEADKNYVLTVRVAPERKGLDFFNKNNVKVFRFTTAFPWPLGEPGGF